jgi:hypothetical protein
LRLMPGMKMLTNRLGGRLEEVVVVVVIVVVDVVGTHVPQRTGHSSMTFFFIHEDLSSQLQCWGYTVPLQTCMEVVVVLVLVGNVLEVEVVSVVVGEVVGVVIAQSIHKPDMCASIILFRTSAVSEHVVASRSLLKKQSMSCGVLCCRCWRGGR